jgi:NAD(P)-dependent dehydrogenase (short-subunit alcohol dehydrogenase family)
MTIKNKPKVILITGISSGFGKEISKELAKKGHIVYGSIRSKCDVDKGVKTVFIELTQTQSIVDAVQKIIGTEGRIDVLINNAGMHSGGPFEDTPDKIIRQQMETNYFGWINAMKCVIPHMRKQGGGKIINISSIGGLTGMPFQGVYSASKFAIEAASAAMRTELRPFNIKLVVVNPGDFKTRNVETRIVSIAKNSPYKEQFEKTLRIFERDENGGKHPNKLAKIMCKIVDKKNPKQRYIIGAFLQKLAVYVKRFIPESAFNRIIARYYHIKF